MPKVSDPEKFSVRYRGLERELASLGATAAFAFTHDSYDPASHNLSETISTALAKQHGLPDAAVIRDLTMPGDDNKPIYEDPLVPRLVHILELSNFIKDKSNVYEALPEIHPQTIVADKEEILEASAAIMGKYVVVKPVTGQLGEGVFIGPKSEVKSHPMADGRYLVQEYIDTSAGIEELGITGVHNLRLISIDSQMVGAIGRLAPPEGGKFLHGGTDLYGQVYLPEELPSAMTAIAEAVHQKLKGLPGEGKNVIAIDMMRGLNSAGEEVDVICEVNRRPLRISEWDLREPQMDPKGIGWLSRQWDKAEAQMLAKVHDEQEGVAQ